MLDQSLVLGESDFRLTQFAVNSSMILQDGSMAARFLLAEMR